MNDLFEDSDVLNSDVLDSLNNMNKTMENMGQKIDASMPHGECPLHNSMGAVNEIPGICCYETMCQVSCGHFTSKRECKQGLSIRSIPLDEVNLLHAQLLVASAIRSTKAINPMLGKRKEPDIVKECQKQSEILDHSLESIKRLKLFRSKKYSEEELASMDRETSKLLRLGQTFQRYLKSKRETVVVTPNPKTGGMSSVGSDYEHLVHFHKWMFPRV